MARSPESEMVTLHVWDELKERGRLLVYSRDEFDGGLWATLLLVALSGNKAPA